MIFCAISRACCLLFLALSSFNCSCLCIFMSRLCRAFCSFGYSSSPLSFISRNAASACSLCSVCILLHIL